MNKARKRHPLSGSLDNHISDKDPSQFRVHDGVLNTTDPYYANEPARHKLLDFVGDVRLVGMPMQGHFTIYKPGHKANAAFSKYLIDYIHQKPIK